MNAKALRRDLKETAKMLHRRQFAEEYVVDFDPRRAAVAAGYPESAWRALLNHPDVDRVVRARISEKRRMLKMEGVDVLRELTVLATSNVKDLLGPDWDLRPLSELTEEQAAAIAMVEVTDDPEAGRRVKFKVHDKLKALELLGKNLKLFVERHEHDVAGNLAELMAEARQRVVEAHDRELEGAEK